MTSSGLYLEITDGTYRALIADGSGRLPSSGYALAQDGWAPVISARRRDDFGGRGPYLEVDEEVEINVFGATAGECLARLQSLERLIDRAERWMTGETLQVTYFKYLPRGSGLTSPLQTQVLGRPAGDNLSGLRLAPQFNKDLKSYVISGVRLRFRRFAELVGADETKSGSATNPTKVNLSAFSNIDTLSPCKLVIAGFPANFAQASVLVLLGLSNNLAMTEGEAMTASKYTSVADGAALASGGSVLRYTPIDTTEAFSGSQGTGLGSTPKRIAFFAAVRNNSASVGWRLRVAVQHAYNFGSGLYYDVAYTPYTLIPAGSTSPQVVSLGIVAAPSTVTNYRLGITASSTSGSPTLDIDYIFALEISDPMSRALILTPATPNALGSTWELTIDDQRTGLLAQPAPICFAQQGANYIHFNHRGDPLLTQYGTSISVLAAGTSGTYWRMVNAGSAFSLTYTLTRHNAYLMPI